MLVSTFAGFALDPTIHISPAEFLVALVTISLTPESRAKAQRVAPVSSTLLTKPSVEVGPREVPKRVIVFPETMKPVGFSFSLSAKRGTIVRATTGLVAPYEACTVSVRQVIIVNNRNFFTSGASR